MDKNLAVYEDEVERILRDGALEEVICSDQLLIAVLKLSDRERKPGEIPYGFKSRRRHQRGCPCGQSLPGPLLRGGPLKTRTWSLAPANSATAANLAYQMIQ